MLWANDGNLVTKDSKLICVSYDDHRFTAESKIRTDIVITVIKSFYTNNDKVQIMNIPGGLCATVDHSGNYEDHLKKWYNFTQYIPISGYTYAEKYAYDILKFSSDELLNPTSVEKNCLLNMSHLFVP